jgi:tripartite-type tricarboxylate transporter receptor subunit TctC
MPRSLITRRGLAGLATLAALPPGVAAAQSWPARNIRMIVPFAAGTTTDIFARAIANHLTQALGQTVVVDNRSGAGGNIAVTVAARERPDGYSMVFGTSGTHGVNASLYRDPGFDAVKDFAPVVACVTAPVVLVVRPELGAPDFAKLVELGKTRGRPLTFASAGNGTTGHLSQALFELRTGTPTTHVPYRSGAQAITDLLSGQVDAMYYHYLPLGQHVQEGKLRPLGITAPRRAAHLPEVPTMLELGLRDFVVEGWWAIYMPAAAPREAVQRVNAAVNDWLRQADAQEMLRAQGVDPIGGTPEDLAARTAAEVAKWRAIIQEARIEPG